jgi:hypothetical protein
LTEIAEAESEAGLTARAGASLDHAMTAAAEVTVIAGSEIYTVAKLSHALVGAGRVIDAEHLLQSVLVTVRSRESALDRGNGLLQVVEARDDAGLPHDRDLLAETEQAVRVAGPSPGRVILLVRIAQAWVRAGEMQQGAADFAQSLEAIDNGPRNASPLLQAIRGLPFPGNLAGQRDPRLIAAEAPHILKIIQAGVDLDANTPSSSAEALLVLAGALP